jgi:hypothetical protein
MKAQSKSTKLSNHKFIRFLVLSVLVSIIAILAAIAIDVLQHRNEVRLAGWAYVGLGQFMGLGAAAAVLKLVESDRL